MAKKQIMNRLKRIEGQIKGLQNMVEQERNCVEILTQLSAISGALDNTAKEIVKEYARNCFIKYESTQDEKLINELIENLSKFRRM
ncbi:MAG TPA: metal-sensitive transcriptional regulator [Petrotogaceae bacterium]|nr:metal-sensitive transcriptional regulator [Petrotogaceae bacterium]HNY37614.1 metal-sensitive transcriptional regulator [Petrotogaceae bacterium]HOG34818.1 metal-sensitive transcriptional regulator [Petrotogaceae bacterium]HPG47645.1 metal-sensitive transcriptional regulator [Petrotogaceae bacterium]HPO26512.1 metal-sensitive transcriptional regulator [Petrotogaceae bacterium]